MCFIKRNLHLNTIDSTSAYIMRRRFLLKNLSSVSADFQTEGRGREDRVWKSEKGKNLLISFLIKDKTLLNKFGTLSMGTALSVVYTLKEFGVSGKIKWPNDVYVSDKKICGILLNGVSGKKGICALSVGVGVNVNQEDFIGEFNATPTSLKLVTGRDTDLLDFKKRLIFNFNKICDEIKKGEDKTKELNGISYLNGKEVYAEINGEKALVKVVKINSDCTLKVISDGEEKSINYGEITFRK